MWSDHSSARLATFWTAENPEDNILRESGLVNDRRAVGRLFTLPPNRTNRKSQKKSWHWSINISLLRREFTDASSLYSCFASDFSVFFQILLLLQMRLLFHILLLLLRFFFSVRFFFFFLIRLFFLSHSSSCSAFLDRHSWDSSSNSSSSSISQTLVLQSCRSLQIYLWLQIVLLLVQILMLAEIQIFLLLFQIRIFLELFFCFLLSLLLLI
jgi:hypothetical protein